MALRVIALLAVAVSTWTLAPAATAAAPERETITFSDTFADDELSAARGVAVTTTFTGRITTLTFSGRPVGPQDLTSVHVDFVASAGDNRFHFKDVGVDVIRVTPDGTALLMAVGQLPFEFTGALKVNLDTGEVILEPRHQVDTSRACAALTR
ncbi:MAG: hypothetical protein ACRDV2_04930 [Actinomycetes bacterium]